MHANRHTRGQRWLAWVMAVVLCLGLLPGAALAAEETTYEQVTSADQFTSGEYYMVTDTGYAPGVLDGTWVSAVKVTDGSVPNAIWTLTVTGNEVTLQDQDGTFVAPSGGNNNGIKGTTDKDKDEAYQWAWEFDNGNGTFTFSGQGEDTVVLASNKNSGNKFRAYKTTTVAGNPNGYPSEFTLYKVINGSQPGEGGDTTEADPQAGAVASGTEITLTCATANAQIYYTLDGSDPSDGENVNRELYSEDNKPTIAENCTLKAIAVLGENQSAVQILNYTIQEDEPTTEAPIADGDQVVIYNPAYKKALSSARAAHADYYNKGVDITINGEQVTSYTDAEVWTVNDNGDGTWSFSNNGQNIGMDEEFTSMPQGGQYDKWEVQDQGDGTYHIYNPNREAYIEWFASNNYWSAYYTINSGSEDLFALQFYKVTGEIPDEPDDSLPIKDGDSVGIYLPREQLVMTTTASGNRLSGASATLADGSLTTEVDNAEFAVSGNNTDGFQFVSDGKYLTTGKTGNSLTMEAASSDYSLWVLEQNGEDGWFIKSVNAHYNTNPQYMEYYGSSFTTYSKYNDSNAAIYTFQFYPIAGTEEPDEPDVTGLEVRATPASGASVEAGDIIELTAADRSIPRSPSTTPPTAAIPPRAAPCTPTPSPWAKARSRYLLRPAARRWSLRPSPSCLPVRAPRSRSAKCAPLPIRPRWPWRATSSTSASSTPTPTSPTGRAA